jgi:hypothetical protein
MFLSYAGTASPFLKRLGRQAGRPVAERVRQDLTDCATELNAGGILVVFGGHFNSGKSSMINMLIGQSLLPVSSYPETGVACAIRSGRKDSIAVVAPDGTRMLPFGTGSIVSAVSITDEGGSTRDVVRENTRLDITLHAAGAIGADAVWVDSPGINDSSAMTERAQTVARDADVLIWVVNSRQPVAEVEQAALQDHIASHGPASVAFLVNAFLEADTKERWDDFMTRLAPGHLARIEQLVDTGSIPKQVIFASARAAAAQPRGFGGPEARGLLADLSDAAHWRVTATRAYRVKARLGLLGSELDRLANAETRRLAAGRADLQLAHDQAGRRYDDFIAEVGRQVREVLARHREAADAAVTATEGSADTTAKAENFYGQALTTQLNSVAEKIAGELAAAVSTSARAHRQAELSTDAARQLATLLKPAAIQVEGFNKSLGVGAGVASGAAAGLAAGTVVPILGHAIGLGLGAVIGGVKARSVRDERLARLRSQIRASGTAGVTAMFASGDRIVELVKRNCPPRLPRTTPDESRLTCLRESQATVAQLAAEVEAADQSARRHGATALKAARPVRSARTTRPAPRARVR